MLQECVREKQMIWVQWDSVLVTLWYLWASFQSPCSTSRHVLVKYSGRGGETGVRYDAT